MSPSRRNKAYRRKQYWRLRKKYVKLAYQRNDVDYIDDDEWPRWIGVRVSTHACECSCIMCTWPKYNRTEQKYVNQMLIEEQLEEHETKLNSAC